MLKNAFFLSISLITASNVNAEIYKCTVNGKTEFSGTPCAINAEKLEVKIHRPSEEAIKSAEAANAFNKQYNKNSDILNEISGLEITIADLEAEIIEYKQALYSELESLRSKKARAANNLAGAQWENSISEEMTAVTDKYRLMIDSANLRITKNEERITHLKSQIQQ